MNDKETTATADDEPPVANLRVRAARGTIVNSAFQVGLALLGLLKRVAVAAFLTREEFGVWGIILAVLVTLVWLKQVGIADKFIQQSEPDQEAAFQKAFTLELMLSFGYFALCCVVLPLYALAYGHGEILLPGVILGTSVILTAFQSVAWIPYRRLQYARQRLLTSVDPVVSIVATIALGAAGYGYWGLVAGALIGSVAAAVVCIIASPYKLRLRFDRQTLREYVSFSWPLLGLGFSRLLVVQGSLLTANRAVGLAGVGAIGLATNFAAFSDRVNSIVSQTIYPAVCAVADRGEALREVFLKSNRVALMWAMPFGMGLALFAGDLVNFLLGDQWDSAVGLLAAFGVICGFGQLAFNWTVFMRALNRTRPLFAAALLEVAVFVVVLLPATLAFGLTGYAIGFAATTLVQIAARTYFMRTLFSNFNIVRHMLRAVVPAVPPVLLVLAVRAVVPGDRTLSRAIAEFALYVLATVASTFFFERRLIAEMVGYLRGRRTAPKAPAEAAARA
jgi:PST family polysaccharide transporter/lipopolysaccharide exporter